MTTDQELWDSIRGNNEKAFATLFYRYSSNIYSTAYSYVRDREVCEQIVQDIFISLWTNRATLDIKSFKSYLTSASRYKVYKHLTACRVVPLVYKAHLEEHQFDHYTQNEAQSNLACEELQLEVDSCLQTLPKRCREIFVMSRTQDLSNDEIADRLGISKRTVENQITYALRQLRYSLKDVSVMLMILEGLHHLRS